MKYICLIYTDEATNPKLETPEFSAVVAAYSAFNQEVQSAGVYICGEPLQSVSTATTVAIRDGQTHITDGPFAETKEQLGGFYILDCKDLDEAIGYAAKIPASHRGRIEVRPLMTLPEGS